MVDGSVVIDTALDTKGVDLGIGEITKSLSKIGRLVAVSFGIGSLAVFAKQSIELASDIAEVDNVVQKAFGNMRGEMGELADTSIQKLGMSRLTAYRTGSTFMSMGRSMLDSAEDAKTMALELTKLTGNMASFFNVSQDLASIALKSIYTGETETLKQYGVVMTEVNLKQFAMEKGIKKQYSAMTQSEKVALRYQYVMNQLSYIGDDFVDTQDSWANQTRILTEQWKEFMSIVGSGLITALTPVIRVINQIIGALISLGRAIQNVLGKFGVQFQSVSNGSSDYDKLSDSVDGYGDSVADANKKAKKSLASFDELNTLADTSGGAGGVGGALDGFDLDVEQTVEVNEAMQDMSSMLDGVIDRLKELADLFKQGFDEGFVNKKALDDIIKNAESIKNSLKDIFTDSEVQKSANEYYNSLAKMLGKVSGSIASVGVTIAQNLTGGIAKYLSGNTQRIKDYLISMFSIGTEINEIIGNFAEAFANIFSAFGGENGQQLTANLIGMIVDPLMSISELVSKIGRDILELLFQPIIDNQESLKTALDGMLGVFASVTGSIKTLLDQLGDIFNEKYDKYIKPFVDNVASGISSLLGTFLRVFNENVIPILGNMANKFDEVLTHVAPFADAMGEMLGKVISWLQVLWNEVLVPLFTWFIENAVPKVIEFIGMLFDNISETITLVLDMFTGLFDSISQIIDGLILTFQGIIDFIVGVFTGDWDRAWQGVLEIFEGLKTGMKGVINGIITMVETMANAIVKAVNKMIEALNNLNFDFPDWLPIIGGKAFGVSIKKIPEIKIPRLATGAVLPANKPFLSVVGDQKSGTNVEAPLDTIKQALTEAMNENGGNRTGDVYISAEGDLDALIRLLSFKIKEEDNRMGMSFSQLGATT